jgi:hypothetical protein
MKNYTHNFACWAAARAIHNPQNKGTKTKIIKAAIEKVGFEKYIENPQLLESYKNSHKVLVNKLNKELDWNLDEQYGVLAKIIAMYFKVSLILTNKAPKKILEQIYPPIDSHHLKTIGLQKLRWTNMNAKVFNQSIDALEIYCKQHSVDFIAFEGNHPLV